MVKRFSFRDIYPYSFLFPALMLGVGAVVLPLIHTAILAFTDAKLGAVGDPAWIGLDNFKFLMRDRDFWLGLRNTLTFSAISVFCEMVIAIAVALLLNGRFRVRALTQTIVLIPWMVPTIASAKIWAWMFNDAFGIINVVLLRIGVLKQPLAWLAEDRLALFAIILADVWKSTPFVVVTLLAALQEIPRHLYEVAVLEASSPIRTFFTVTLPLLKPALFIAALFRLLDTLRAFDLPYVLGEGGRSTRVLATFARQHLVDFQDIGFGSAACVLNFLIIVGLMAAYVACGRHYLIRAPR